MTISDDTSNEYHNDQYHTPGQLTTGKALPLCMLLIPFRASSIQTRLLFASVEKSLTVKWQTILNIRLRDVRLSSRVSQAVLVKRHSRHPVARLYYEI